MTLSPRIRSYVLLFTSFEVILCMGLAQGELCSLCPEGQVVEKTLRSVTLPAGTSQLARTCRELDQFVKNLAIDSTAPQCSMVSSVGAECGCIAPAAESENPLVTSTNSAGDAALSRNDTSNSSPSDPAPNRCSLCSNDGVLESPGAELNFVPPFDPAPRTCGELDTLVQQTFSEHENECHMARNTSQGSCRCTGAVNKRNESMISSTSATCHFCPNDEAIPYPDRVLKLPVRDSGLPLPADGVSCQTLATVVGTMPTDSKQCFVAHHINYMCGCNNGERSYLGADTETKRAVLSWLPRIGALASFLGSALILRDVVRNRDQRQQQRRRQQRGRQSGIYYELVFGMSIGDVIGSLAWSLTTLPIPQYQNGIPTEIYGAVGNDATCTVQGFFIQLGYIGVFYNMMLSVYYVLVVRFGHREQQLKKLRAYLHLPPLIVGSALAFAGIPFYENVVFGCHIAPPPLQSSYGPILAFSVVPIAIVILVATTNISLVYLKVRQIGKAGRRWEASARSSDFELPEQPPPRRSIHCCCSSCDKEDPGSSSARSSAASRNERIVLLQSLAYLAAFYISWPLYMAGNLNRMLDDYGFYLTVFFATPLMGLWNSFVYFGLRPKGSSRRKNRNENS